MKTKHTLIILGIGYCIEFIGTLAKILHIALADFLLTVGMVLKVVGLILFLYKLFTHPKAKEFLNW
jgi:hypothetical protein